MDQREAPAGETQDQEPGGHGRRHRIDAAAWNKSTLRMRGKKEGRNEITRRNPLSQEAVIQNLEDAGCSAEFIRRFLEASGKGGSAPLCLLDSQRKELLGQLRAEQRKLECLDYLRYQMQKERKQQREGKNMNRLYLKILCLAAAVGQVLLAPLTGCGVSGSPPSGGERVSAPENSASAPASGALEESTVRPSAGGDEAASQAPEFSGTESGEENAATDETENTISATVTVGNAAYTAALEQNETVRALIERFPLTLEMSELNGNEKYVYLNNGLPTDPRQPGQIRAGDLMLCGDCCLVLFYESFSSGYSYTVLGSLDDPAGLTEAVGTGSTLVTFDLTA